MSLSRNFEDYLEVRFEDLRGESEIPVDLFLLFQLNSHVMRWKRAGEYATADAVKRYWNRGLRRIWIRKADEAAWKAYLQGPAEEPSPVAAAPSPEPEPPRPEPVPEPELPPPRTEEGGVLAEALTSDELKPEEKKAIVAETAREMLQDLTSAKTVEEQKEANKKAWQSIQDVMDAIADRTASAVAETWKLAEIDPDLEHAVNVATYAAIFAMAFGKIENDLIQDLALAGLLHDLGMCEIDANLAALSWNEFKDDQKSHYANHVPATLRLIQTHAPEVPERVKQIISQHHEKFDGTGYPKKLSGFQIDDIAQLVSMSDFLHGMSTGQFDGKERTLKESFETLEKLEKARTFPEYFNPDVYAVVVGWIRRSVTQDVSGKASEVVLAQVQGMLKQAGGDGGAGAKPDSKKAG